MELFNRFTIVTQLIDVVTHLICLFLIKYVLKSQAEEMDVKEQDGVLKRGTIKDKGTGIYHVVGSKLQTSYPIHTEAGGDPDVYWHGKRLKKVQTPHPPED